MKANEVDIAMDKNQSGVEDTKIKNQDVKEIESWNNIKKANLIKIFGQKYSKLKSKYFNLLTKELDKNAISLRKKSNSQPIL